MAVRRNLIIIAIIVAIAAFVLLVISLKRAHPRRQLRLTGPGGRTLPGNPGGQAPASPRQPARPASPG